MNDALALAQATGDACRAVQAAREATARAAQAAMDSARSDVQAYRNAALVRVKREADAYRDHVMQAAEGEAGIARGRPVETDGVGRPIDAGQSILALADAREKAHRRTLEAVMESDCTAFEAQRMAEWAAEWAHPGDTYTITASGGSVWREVARRARLAAAGKVTARQLEHQEIPPEADAADVDGLAEGEAEGLPV